MAQSSLGIKYPTLRDHPLHSGDNWLEGKRSDDGAEGLWRIHDNLYDLNKFIENHPGGSDWLELTKGTDITEAFETHHIYENASNLLPKFFIRKAKLARNSPFTFYEDGFYKTLKREVRNDLGKISNKPQLRSKFLTDCFFVLYLILAVLASYFGSFFVGGLAGVALHLTAIAAHNFFHQKNNFRMYYFDFTLMQSREWRISHVLSHHCYTNTINDLEISSLEPFLQYLPHKKNFFVRYLSWFYSPIVYSVIFFAHFIKTLLSLIISRKKIQFAIFLPFIVPILMLLISQRTSLFCIFMFAWIEIIASLIFGVVGVNAAHHHPDIFHDGDTPRPKDQMDWGIYQLDAVMDRKDITGSHFLVLTNFGDHALHHLFPTIDHGILEHLYPTFLKVCQKFGIEWRLSSQLDLIKGQFKQLAKIKPKSEPPKFIYDKKSNGVNKND